MGWALPRFHHHHLLLLFLYPSWHLTFSIRWPKVGWAHKAGAAFMCAQVCIKTWLYLLIIYQVKGGGGVIWKREKPRGSTVSCAAHGSSLHGKHEAFKHVIICYYFHPTLPRSNTVLLVVHCVHNLPTRGPLPEMNDAPIVGELAKVIGNILKKQGITARKVNLRPQNRCCFDF